MIALDANVLLSAHRVESAQHERGSAVVIAAASGSEPVGLSDVVLSAVVRIATSPRLHARPSTHDQVFGFLRALLARRNVARLAPGDGHFPIFERLCRHADARGNLVTDAWLAALAIEHDCEWVSFDQDFALFPGLRWRNPAHRPEVQ